MMYDIESFLEEFAKRIKTNSVIIDERCEPGKNGYEITQRIASLTALLVVCVKKYGHREEVEVDSNSCAFRDLEDLIKELIADNRIFSDYKDSSALLLPNGEPNVTGFLIHLRNSLAHADTGLNFFPIDTGDLHEITHIYLRDTDIALNQFAPHVFCAKLRVLPYEDQNSGKILLDDLSRLTEDIGSLFANREKSLRCPNKTLSKEYIKEIKLLDSILSQESNAVKNYYCSSPYLSKGFWKKAGRAK